MKKLPKKNTILEIDQQQDFWDRLPNHVKEDVEEALQQSERGEGTPHEKVMKKYDKWRAKSLREETQDEVKARIEKAIKDMDKGNYISLLMTGRS